MIKLMSAKIKKKISCPCYIILKIQMLEGQTVDPDEMTRYELPHLDLCWLVNVTFFSIAPTKKQTTKFSSANYQKMLSPSYIILRIQRLER